MIGSDCGSDSKLTKPRAIIYRLYTRDVFSGSLQLLISPILQMRKLRLTKAKRQEVTHHKWQNEEIRPILSPRFFFIQQFHAEHPLFARRCVRAGDPEINRLRPPEALCLVREIDYKQ